MPGGLDLDSFILRPNELWIVVYGSERAKGVHRVGCTYRNEKLMEMAPRMANHERSERRAQLVRSTVSATPLSLAWKGKMNGRTVGPFVVDCS